MASEKSKKARMTIYSILENDLKKTVLCLNKFQRILTRLRFEGKQNTGKNIIQLTDLVGYFRDTVVPHMKHEEKIFFSLFTRPHSPIGALDMPVDRRARGF